MYFKYVFYLKNRFKYFFLKYNHLFLDGPTDVTCTPPAVMGPIGIQNLTLICWARGNPLPYIKWSVPNIAENITFSEEVCHRSRSTICFCSIYICLFVCCLLISYFELFHGNTVSGQFIFRLRMIGLSLFYLLTN